MNTKVFVSCLSLLACSSPLDQCTAQSKPGVTVSNIRRVFHNGEHNAFTDLVRFGERFYLTFRSCPDGHMVHPSSTIIVLASDDLNHWEQVHRFGVELRDTRDPHFLVFQQKLFIYTGTWYSGKSTLPRAQYDLNQHVGYAVWTENGQQWSQPTMLEGTYGHYIWRAAAFGETAFLCGRRKHHFREGPKGEGIEVESLMLESSDGLIWRKRAVFQPQRGDETAFLFEEDGSVLAIGRAGNLPAQVLRARLPYTTWDRRELDRYVGGPLLARWGKRYLVGGRQQTPNGPRTTLYWLIDNELQEFATLPSAGDNSYPGFVALSPKTGVVSWYSSHEVDALGKAITAIYMADLTLAD